MSFFIIILLKAILNQIRQEFVSFNAIRKFYLTKLLKCTYERYFIFLSTNFFLLLRYYRTEYNRYQEENARDENILRFDQAQRISG